MDENTVLQREENVEKATINNEESEENKEGAEVINEEIPEQSAEICIGDFLNNIVELNEKMDEMNHLFIQKIQHSAHEEKIVDQMHAELQKYKDDLYSQLVRPILLDIIEIRDSIIRMSKSYAEKGDEDQTVPLKVFSDYAYDVQDVLEKNNIAIYQGQPGEPFSPIKQRAIKKVTTPVEELHGKIAESLSCGYEYMGKTISPEKVVVYYYEKPVIEMEGETE